MDAELVARVRKFMLAPTGGCGTSKIVDDLVKTGPESSCVRNWRRSRASP